MEKICLASTVKAPLEQTLSFVNYHLNIGIDRLIIFFDDPNDATINHLERVERVEVIKCDKHYWSKHNNAEGFSHVDRQLININTALEIAKKNNFQWLIHIDSDELIFPIGDIKTILKNFDGDEIRFTINEAIPEQLHYDSIFSASLFKRPINLFQKAIGKLICRNSFLGGEYFRGHLISKSAIRITNNIRTIGIHYAEFKDKNVKTKISPSILLLHFDCIGLEDWKSKWESKAHVSTPSKLKRLKKNRRKQLNMFLEAQKEGEEKMARCYQKTYCVPKYERIILKLLRMAHTIHLDQNLVQPNIETTTSRPVNLP